MKTRSAAGEVKVMRIFRYLPQTALPHHLREAQILMDSLYHVLETHPDIDFRTLVNKYSDDKKEFWMGWLQTSQEFEEVAFSLKMESIQSRFYTQGYTDYQGDRQAGNSSIRTDTRRIDS